MQATVRELRAKLGRQRGPHFSVGILHSDGPPGSAAYRKQVRRQALEHEKIALKFVEEGSTQLLADALHRLFELVPELKEVSPCV